VTNSSSGLTLTDGSAINLQLVGDTVVGVVSGGAFNGQAAFAISINAATGAVTVEQYLSLDHPTEATAGNGFVSYDETLALASGSLGVTVTVKDGDNDTAKSNTADVSNQITFDAGPPGTTIVLSVTDPSWSCPTSTASTAVSVDFLDVSPGDIFHDFVAAIARAGITAGCGLGNYCRDASITRAQMAVFLLKAKYGSAYTPPACTGAYLDVPCPSTFADWVEQLSAEGITAGCGADNYCPDDAVLRAQMAVFLLRSAHGPAYVPPACTGIFEDVPCPGNGYAAWIERLSAEGVTAGCSTIPSLYCPSGANTRGQMSVFLTKAFGLPLP